MCSSDLNQREEMARKKELWRREDEKYKYEQSILPPAADINAARARAVANAKREDMLSRTQAGDNAGWRNKPDLAESKLGGPVLTREETGFNAPAFDRAVSGAIPALTSGFDPQGIGLQQGQSAPPDFLQRQPQADAAPQFSQWEKPDFGYMNGADYFEKAIQDTQAKEAFPQNKVLAVGNPALDHAYGGLPKDSVEGQRIARANLGIKTEADLDAESARASGALARQIKSRGDEYDKSVGPLLKQAGIPEDEIAKGRAYYMLNGKLRGFGNEEDLNPAGMLYLKAQQGQKLFGEKITPQEWEQWYNEAKQIGKPGNQPITPASVSMAQNPQDDFSRDIQERLRPKQQQGKSSLKPMSRKDGAAIRDEAANLPEVKAGKMSLPEAIVRVATKRGFDPNQPFSD